MGEQTVTIYHCVRGAELEVIRRDGLKSRKRLAEEGMLSLPVETFGNQPQYIYFQDIPDERLAIFRKTENLAAIQVNPDTTYVFNREFRVPKAANGARGGEESDLARSKSYVRSGITLRQHLHNQAIAAQMQEQLQPRQVILRGPGNGMPFVTSHEDKRGHDDRYLYRPDILIEADCIPPDKLKLHAKTTF